MKQFKEGRVFILAHSLRQRAEGSWLQERVTKAERGSSRGSFCEAHHTVSSRAEGDFRTAE